MSHLRPCFPALVYRAYQVLGQLEYFNRRDKPLFGELIIINAKGSKKRTDLLFLGTALKIHRILQLILGPIRKLNHHI